MQHDSTTQLVQDFEEATEREANLRYEADLASVERALVLGQLHRAGMSYGQIAELVGLSRSRVQQMVEKVRAA